MLDIVNDYAGDHIFQIHPVKSNAIIKTVGTWKIDRVAENQNELKLGDNTLHFKSETSHLGLTRSNSDENRINIEERIALAKRTLCSFMKTGVHGTNGMNPRTSCQIYQVYVIPRLLYCLETLNLQNKDMATLCSFHLSTLKRLHSLPIRTANSAVYLLLEILPISAGTHWVALYIHANSRGEYYNLTGRPPFLRSYVNFMNKHCTSWTYNTIRVQEEGSTVCGHHCIFYLIHRCTGKSMGDVTRTLRHPREATDIVNTCMHRFINKA
jgi:hypothetical protein